MPRRSDCTRCSAAEFTHHRITRLRRGVYLPTTHWERLDLDARYLFRIRAYAAVSADPPVFSHHSAAVIWGFPRPASWPTDVHITVPQASGGRSKPGIVRHGATTPDALESSAVRRGGLLVTSAAHTAVAMARVFPFPRAVAMMDKAIHVPRRTGPRRQPGMDTCDPQRVAGGHGRARWLRPTLWQNRSTPRRGLRVDAVRFGRGVDQSRAHVLARIHRSRIAGAL